ncbi:MAG: N-acetylglucosamine-6-phosphate deacetylase [Pyrinomonadaceae bacterium]
MAKATFTNVLIAASGADGSWDIVVEDDRIASVVPAAGGGGDVNDCGGLTAFPGFIDIHNHGAVGVDVNEADVDGLVAVGKFLATQGVTAWMPTLVPDSDEAYRRAIDAIDRLIEVQTEMPIAQAVGVHYEGVFANEKMCGALRPEYFRSFHNGSPAEEKRGIAQSTKAHEKTRNGISLRRLKNGLHMTTFAPEIEGGIELAGELARQKWIASIGHTRADVAVLEAAFKLGARHVTHFFNAMTGIHHRDIGVAGWAASNPEVTFDIIADGIHVHPRMLEMATRTKGTDKVLLISDSVAPTGLGDGEFELWGEKVTVENKRTRNERGSIAGSVISMFDAFKGMRSIGFSAAEVARMASTNPAKLLGLESSHGSLQPGMRADIVLIGPDGSIRSVLIGGRFVSNWSTR